MNYAVQDRFFGGYRSAAIGITAGAGAILSLALWMQAASREVLGTVALGLVAFAALYGMCYLPLYLQLSVEAQKKHGWAVRVRWPILGLIVAAATYVALRQPLLPLGRQREALILLAASIGIEIVALVMSRALLKQGSGVAVPAVLAVVEYTLLGWAYVSGALSLSGVIVLWTVAYVLYASASPAGFAWWLLGVAPFPLILLVVRGAIPEAALAVYSAIVVSGSAVLKALALRHHIAQVAATTEELSSFAAITEVEATELLATSTGILARSWLASTPADPPAVERWYEENSKYYLYDLAQFHLAYKHIAFMRDVVSMSRGRVLDHGGGIGDVSLELARRGHSVTYLDVDGQTKAFARWKAEREGLVVEFASSLDEIEGAFDTIVSLDVLEHLPDPDEAVERLVALLGPGGRMIVTAYFGPTKAHPMHFDHKLDLSSFLQNRGLRNAKTFAMSWVRSEFLRKRGVLVYERP